MSEPYEIPYISEAELMERAGARARDYATGRTLKNSVEPEVIRFIDDGYRIYATWVSGGPISPKPGECVFVAEYKQCDFPTLGAYFADALMLADNT